MGSGRSVPLACYLAGSYGMLICLAEAAGAVVERVENAARRMRV